MANCELPIATSEKSAFNKVLSKNDKTIFIRFMLSLIKISLGTCTWVMLMLLDYHFNSFSYAEVCINFLFLYFSFECLHIYYVSPQQGRETYCFSPCVCPSVCLSVRLSITNRVRSIT